MSTTKITFKVWAGLWRKFNQQIQSLRIHRDGFLDDVLRTETPRLAKALAGRKLSRNANRHIAGELKKLQTIQVSVLVEKETADTLNRLVEKSNLVRDAFFNRIVMYLRSSDALLKHLGLSKYDTGQYGYPPPHVSPLKAMEEAFADPLAVLHAAAEEILEDNLYLVPLSEKLAGFSCWLDDTQVPNTERFRKEQAELAEMMSYDLEEAASLSPKAGRKG